MAHKYSKSVFKKTQYIFAFFSVPEVIDYSGCRLIYRNCSVKKILYDTFLHGMGNFPVGSCSIGQLY